MGAGLSLFIGLITWLSNYDGTRPVGPVPFGALMAIVGFWAASTLLRGWPRQAVFQLALLTAAGGALMTWAICHYAGLSATAGALSTVLFAGLILRRTPHRLAHLLLAVAVVVAGGLWGWAITGWGVLLAGATGGLGWALVDPEGVGNYVFDLIAEN